MMISINVTVEIRNSLLLMAMSSKKIIFIFYQVRGSKSTKEFILENWLKNTNIIEFQVCFLRPHISTLDMHLFNFLAMCFPSPVKNLNLRINDD